MTALLLVGVDAVPSAAADRLLELLGWLEEHHPEVDVHVVLLRGGPLVHRFHAAAPTTVVEWYDRRADQQEAAAVFRGSRRRRWFAALIDRWSTATLPGRLPRPPADVVLVSGWEALGAGPLGAGRAVPRVALLPDGASAGTAPAGIAPPGTDRRAGRARRSASTVLTGRPSPVEVWSAIDAAAPR